MTKITTILMFLFLIQACYTQKPYSTYIWYDNDFDLINNEYFSGKDTLVISYYETGEVKSKGKYACDKTGRLSGYKVGNWTEYYLNGVLKSIGDYQISSFIDCGTAGLERIFYNYKIGDWTYLKNDSSIEARGTYKTIKTNIDTRCQGGDNLLFMTITENWFFSNAPNTESIDKTKYVTVSTEFDDGFKIEYFYDSNKDKVEMKFGN